MNKNKRCRNKKEMTVFQCSGSKKLVLPKSKVKRFLGVIEQLLHFLLSNAELKDAKKVKKCQTKIK